MSGGGSTESTDFAGQEARTWNRSDWPAGSRTAVYLESYMYKAMVSDSLSQGYDLHD